MKIVDLRCAVIGSNPVVRVITDEGLSGYGQIESTRPYLRGVVPLYRELVVDEDPTQVERVMLRIRRLGGFKPWGSAVSAIEMALWDIAGQAAGLPVHRLLGGKIRDRVRVYSTSPYVPMTDHSPAAFARRAAEVKAMPEGFTLMKQAVGFHHAGMLLQEPGAWYGEPRGGAPHPNRGLLRERSLGYFVECVTAMKEVLGDEVALAWTAVRAGRPRTRSRSRERSSRCGSPGSRTSSAATTHLPRRRTSTATCRARPRSPSRPASRSTCDRASRS